MTRQTRRLTGVRIPRGVDLNSAESTARIQRVMDRFRARYPDPHNGLHRARQHAAALSALRETGFTDEDRAELLAWAERCVRGD